MGIITRLLSSFGPETVAAFGVSSRIEFFALTVVRALSTVLAPFIGQNWGASRYDRAVSGVKYSKLFSIFWGGVLYIGFLLLAKPIASIFNSDTDVIRGITLYLRIVPLGYGLQGILLLAISALNVLRKPLHASFLRIAQMFVIFVPLAFLGSALLGVPGIFAALTISYCMIGTGSSILLNKIMSRESVKNL
jgi:Na+-driven multidrug efflux pump